MPFKTLLIVSLLLVFVASCKKDSTTTTSTISNAGSYSQTSGSETLTSQTFTSSATDGSALYISGSSSLALWSSIVSSTSAASSTDNSLQYGITSAVVALSGSTLELHGNKITSTGTGANAVYAYGTATISLTGDTVNSTGAYSHGLVSYIGGTITGTNVKVETTGANASAIYSGGSISLTSSSLSATNSEAAVVQSGYSLNLSASNLSTSVSNLYGVMIYNNVAGDITINQGHFSMTGGSLSYSASAGPLFYVTNSTGIINLKGVNISSGSDVLVKASTSSWGTSGLNGGEAIVSADGQTLAGKFIADGYSLLMLTLQNGSKFTGAFNNEKTAFMANISLDASSTWTLTADSYISTFDNASGISGTTISNITGNGHNLYYLSSINSDLGGKTYTLVNGGELRPY